MAIVAGCDDPPSPTPTGPITPVIVRLEISGPDTIAPGRSAQMTAFAHFSDGVRQPVAARDVVWGSNVLVLRMNADGVATALDQVGDTTINASWPIFLGGTRPGGGKVITIVPGGTFRMVGRVTDAEAPSVPVPGALIEVTPGPLVTTTDIAGQYKLYGVPAEATVRITMGGFQAVERRLTLTAHATQDFNLPPDGARPVLSGPYTLAIDVGSACSDSNFSNDHRHRRYEAVLTQNGGNVDVALVEPRFRVNSAGRGKGFSGVAFSGGATFTLLNWDPDLTGADPLDYPDVVELLPDGTVLVPQGAVTMTGTAAGLSGQMGSGSVMVRYGAGFPSGSFFGGCNYLSPIVFTLTPR